MRNICKAWSENSNTRCPNKAISGSDYCWSHYPKRAFIIEFFVVFLLTFFLTLTVNDPAISFLSKFRIFYYLDKNAPIINTIKPALDKISSVDKTTEYFELFYSDKDSGLNIKKSSLVVSQKENQIYIPIKGKTDKNNSSLIFIPEKKLGNGEYLFEALLIDKANNITPFNKPFTIRETYELTYFVSYNAYDSSSESDRKLFNSFFENKKDLFKDYTFYIYKLSLSNTDVAILKDIYLDINMPETIFFWEQIGNYNASDIEICGSAAESFDKRFKGYVYASSNSLKLRQLGPHGVITLYVLTGINNKLMEPENKLPKWIDIGGRYISEGYGGAETRDVFTRIALKRN